MDERALIVASNSQESPEDVNLHELMEYYHKVGRFGALALKWQLARSWVLQQLAYASPTSDWSVRSSSFRTSNLPVLKINEFLRRLPNL